MLTSIQFSNFRVLRNTELKLGPLTLLVGPNGSGKSTVFQAIDAAREPGNYSAQRLRSLGLLPVEPVSLRLTWDKRLIENLVLGDENALRYEVSQNHRKWLQAARVYALQPVAIAKPVPLEPRLELAPDGGKLANVLDRLRDGEPERFEALNAELSRWLPEFDRVLFDTPGTGQRAVMLRTKNGHHQLPATDLSSGTLLALALLTLAYLPDPPPLIGLEEPDHGIHPRLLRDVRDAIYRLAYPKEHGENREPVQVIATTHSPYMLDLFRDHLEEIVITNKTGTEATFERLADRPDVEEILGNSALGDAWYTGILGGVPTEP